MPLLCKIRRFTNLTVLTICLLESSREVSTPDGNFTIIRVNFTDVYHAYLPNEVIETYLFVTNGTNDVSTQLFHRLSREHSSSFQLVRI